MKILVCGGRGFGKRAFIRKKLDELHKKYNVTYLISGGATGADTEAFLWAGDRGISRYIYQAQWNLYGRAAGTIRNKKMLNDGKPDIVICFPGGAGTAHMQEIARQEKYKVIRIIEE